MMIKVPMMFVDSTEVEGVFTKEYTENGLINTDNIECVLPEEDGTVTIGMVSGTTCALKMSLPQFEDLLASYEINVYNN